MTPSTSDGPVGDVASTQLRPASPADARAITDVFLASRAATMPYLPRLHSDEDTLAWITHVVLPESQVWVAEQLGERIVGFAALSGAELEHLYLHPDVLRRGIGTALLHEVCKASPRELTLHVFQRNEGARAFYERHGWKAVEFNAGERNEEKEPDATYCWPAAV